VVGALACAEVAREAGLDAIVGGLTWERRPVDPLPGPRRLEELDGAEPLNDVVALCRAHTTGPGGVRFAETRVAEILGRPTVLVDPHASPAALGTALGDAALLLGCDHVVLLDVGGDALAHGDEPGLSSPLADAMLLAAAPSVGLPVTGAIFGAGCDGELTPEEVLARVAEVWSAGGSRGVLGLPHEVVERLRPVVEAVPTEASAMALRCAAGALGRASIRDGRKTVELSPTGGLIFLFDVDVALRSAARLADAVRDAAGLVEANAILLRMGISTELEHESRVAREP
jgi:hypothetical protein